MARLIRYDANPRGLRDLAKSEQVDQMLERKAERVAQAAQAEYDTHPPHTGTVDVEVVQEGSDSDRARVAVIARHPAALAIENDRHVLRNALRAD